MFYGPHITFPVGPCCLQQEVHTAFKILHTLDSTHFFLNKAHAYTHTYTHTCKNTQHWSRIGLVILQTHSLLFCDLHVWVFQVPSTGNAQCGSADILMQLQGTKITVNFSPAPLPAPGSCLLACLWSIRAESIKSVFYSVHPQGSRLNHRHFPIGLSTVLSKLEVFTDILVCFTHTESFHILSFLPSFPIHSPFSIFFLFLRLNLSNAVLVPHIQSWRRQFPASIHIFVMSGRSIQGTDSLSWSAALPNSHSPSFIPPLYHQGPLGPSSVHRTMWKSNLHLPWQAKWERRQEGVRVCKWPWDSDFLWAGSVETDVAGRHRAGSPCDRHSLDSELSAPSLGG